MIRCLIFVSVLWMIGCQESETAGFELRSFEEQNLACPPGSHADRWRDNVPGVTVALEAHGCRDTNDKRHGWHIAWQAPGIKHHEGEFDHGVFVGEWSYYHDDGSLSSRGFFVRGERDGWWDHWNPDGAFTYSKRYETGEVVERRDGI